MWPTSLWGSAQKSWVQHISVNVQVQRCTANGPTGDNRRWLKPHGDGSRLNNEWQWILWVREATWGRGNIRKSSLNASQTAQMVSHRLSIMFYAGLIHHEWGAVLPSTNLRGLHRNCLWEVSLEAIFRELLTRPAKGSCFFASEISGSVQWNGFISLILQAHSDPFITVLLARLQQALSTFFSPKHSECLQKFGFELLTVLQSKARWVL